MNQELNAFALNIQQEVLSLCSSFEGEGFREDTFTELTALSLEETGEMEGIAAVSHRARGIQVNGYSVSDDDQSLDLIITNYSGLNSPGSLTRTAIQTAFKRLATFLIRSLDGYYQSLEETSPGFDMALRIHEVRDSLSRVRLYLFSDMVMVAATDPLPDSVVNGIRISHHIWDIERLYRLWSSGRDREAVEIDFCAIHGAAMPCLMMPDTSEEYATYLLVLPAKVLVNLYGEYGNRLLERNVRSYLQAKGKVNGGIRQTILNEPDMFLAFNNGISATAGAIELADSDGGVCAIRSVTDLQIVNGGQTTASIYHTATKDRADVSRIGVQLKLTVIKDAAKMDEIVPRISLYANSQNKIQAADFSANDPLHRGIESLSRTMWAPAKDGTQKQTRWYYERARGQYLNDRERERTPAAKKRFEQTHPLAQRFSKTDLAKYENTWAMRPHIVSRGAEKNFQDFMVHMHEQGGVEPNQQYFKHLVARAILFKSTEKLVQEQKFGGYRANIVTYTLALLTFATNQRLNLDEIWSEQSLPANLREVIIGLSKDVHRHVVDAPGNGNVTEWCKKEACWNQLRAKQVSLPENLDSMLLPEGSVNNALNDQGEPGSLTIDPAIVAQIDDVDSVTWYELSAWAKETENLQAWQRSLAYSMGNIKSRGRKPSSKQITQAALLLKEAEVLGFSRNQATSSNCHPAAA